VTGDLVFGMVESSIAMSRDQPALPPPEVLQQAVAQPRSDWAASAEFTTTPDPVPRGSRDTEVQIAEAYHRRGRRVPTGPGSQAGHVQVRRAMAMPMQCAANAATVRAWNTSWKPNQRGFGSGRLMP
jgi:hypothetical protein